MQSNCINDGGDSGVTFKAPSEDGWRGHIKSGSGYILRHVTGAASGEAPGFLLGPCGQPIASRRADPSEALAGVVIRRRPQTGTLDEAPSPGRARPRTMPGDERARTAAVASSSIVQRVQMQIDCIFAEATHSPSFRGREENGASATLPAELHETWDARRLRGPGRPGALVFRNVRRSSTPRRMLDARRESPHARRLPRNRGAGSRRPASEERDDTAAGRPRRAGLPGEGGLAARGAGRDGEVRLHRALAVGVHVAAGGSRVTQEVAQRRDASAAG